MWLWTKKMVLVRGLFLYQYLMFLKTKMFFLLKSMRVKRCWTSPYFTCGENTPETALRGSENVAGSTLCGDRTRFFFMALIVCFCWIVLFRWRPTAQVLNHLFMNQSIRTHSSHEPLILFPSIQIKSNALSSDDGIIDWAAVALRLRPRFSIRLHLWMTAKF